MKGSQVEFLFLIKTSVRQELDDLEFATLISNRLAGRGCEEPSLLSRGASIDGYNLFQIIRGLIDGEFSDGQLDVHFHAQGAQTHEVVHDLAQLGTIVEE